MIFHTPSELFEKYVYPRMSHLWGVEGERKMIAPFRQGCNPFAGVDEDVEDFQSREAEQPAEMVTNAGVSNKEADIRDVKASDYVTPQKYLDGADIPTYYAFQSSMVPFDECKHGMVTGFEVDRRLTLPTRTHIRFLVTATDVIHTWACPSLNVRVDAFPGIVIRHNTFILREGVFYGQCGEMCGGLHHYMPIVIEAVSPEAYAAHAKKFYRE